MPSPRPPSRVRRARLVLAALLAPLSGACSCSTTSPSTATLHVPSPAWEEQVIYFVLTDRFANGDRSNDDQKKGEYDPANYDKYSGGDLQGVIDKLDYIQGMGATAVWITPPVANLWWDPLQGSGGYHGYWARHLKKVDEHLGTLDTYKKLSIELHRRGMYLIQDVVPNHMGNFFQYSSYDPNDVTKGFVKNPGATPGSKPEQAPFDQDDVTDPAQKAAAIYHWTPAISNYSDLNQQYNYQVSDLDDLNSENPVVRAALRDSYGYWIKEVGVDAFRVDTAKYVPHDFWNDFFYSTDATSPGMMAVAKATGRNQFHAFGEVFETSDPYDDASDRIAGSFTGTAAKPELPAVLAYPLYGDLGAVFAAGKPTATLSWRLGKMLDPSIYPNAALMPTFVDNHDVRRFLSVGTGNGLVQALAFLFTIPGIPTIYYGTEQGFTETRGALFKGGYKSDQDHYDTNAGLYLRIKALAAVRKASKTLTHGALEVVYDNAAGAGALAYRRTLAGDTVLVVINTAEERVLISGLDSKLPAGTVLEEMHNEQAAPLPVIGAAGKVQLVLRPRAVMVAHATSKVVAPPAPAAAITVATLVDGKTFTQDVTITGAVTPAATKVRLVLDGYLDKGIDATVAADGSWSVLLPVSSFAEGEQQHSLAFYSTDANVSTNPVKFKTNVVFSGVKLDVDDPAGDDKGPGGTYTYPKDTTFGHQMDITHVRAEIGPTTLRLKLTMADFSTVWNPPNKFDHVAFNLYFSLPGQAGGATVMPKAQGSVPAGFTWQYNQFTYGFDPPAMFTSVGATATSYGAPAKAPSVSVNAAAKTIIFTYDRTDFGLATWAGVKIYLSTWDFDGIGAAFRPIVPGGDQYKMGGGQPADPYIMDDVPPFTLPAQ